MAGIEEAFEKFVKRISGKEEPKSEYGDPQTGEKRIPLMQGIISGYDFQNTMPNYYNQRYDYENQMPIYQDDRYNIPQQELAYGGLAEGGLANFIKNNVAPEYRLYTRTMVPGLKTGRLDEEYFPDDFKLDLRKQALDKYAKTGELSGIVNEMDQHTSRGKINKLIKYPSTYAALGTYSYEIDPKTLDVKVKDKYDWNPAYGTKGNFTGWIGNEPEKGGRDVDASMLKDYAVNTMKRGIDIPAGLELLGNLLGPRASKGEGVNIDINIPTEFAAMRADTPYAYGGRVNMSEGGLTNTIPPVKGPDSQGVESLFRRRYN